MKRIRFAAVLLLTLVLASCKQQASTTPQAPGPTDFSYLEAYDLKPYLEGLAEYQPFQDRLQRLTGKAYPTILAALQKGNPQGTLVDGLWFTLYAEYEADGVRYQGTVVADLPQNNLAAGHWNDKTDQVVHFIENAEKMPPPFQSWVEDWN